MDYLRIYHEFITDRRIKESGLSVFETHHVKPRYLKGTDEPENLIRLSLQDHLFAHLLLGRVYGGHLAQCYMRMSGIKRYKTGRSVRINFETMRTRARVKTSADMKALWADPGSVYNSAEYSQKRSESLRGNTFRRGKPQSPEACAAVKAVQVARAPVTSEEKKAHWAAENSPYRTEQYTRRQRESQTGKTRTTTSKGVPKSEGHKANIRGWWTPRRCAEHGAKLKGGVCHPPGWKEKVQATWAAKKQQNSSSEDSACAGAL